MQTFKQQNVYGNSFIFHYHRLFVMLIIFVSPHNFELVLSVYFDLVTSIVCQY
jgi:hypothetical protein